MKTYRTHLNKWDTKEGNWGRFLVPFRIEIECM